MKKDANPISEAFAADAELERLTVVRLADPPLYSLPAESPRGHLQVIPGVSSLRSTRASQDAHIVARAVPEHVLQRVLDANILRILPHNYRQLDLVIVVLPARTLRNDNRVFGSDDAARRFVEQHRHFGLDPLVGIHDVLRSHSPDRTDLSARERGQQTLDGPERGGKSRCRVERGGREDVGCDPLASMVQESQVACLDGLAVVRLRAGGGISSRLARLSAG